MRSRKAFSFTSSFTRQRDDRISEIFHLAGPPFNRFTHSNRMWLSKSQVGMTCRTSLSLALLPTSCREGHGLSRSPSTLPPDYQPSFEAETRNGYSGDAPEFHPESGGHSRDAKG